MKSRRKLALLLAMLSLFIGNQLLNSMNTTLTEAANPNRSLDTWRQSGQADFSGWQLAGLKLTDGHLLIDSSATYDHDPYPAGSYSGGNYYNGGNYYRGEAFSPWHAPAYGFDSAVASWDADTPPGTWVEVYLRVLSGSTIKDYVMGVWANDTGTIKRHSVNNQSDSLGKVDTDTLTMNSTATAYQVRVRFFTTNLKTVPALRLVAVNSVKNGAAVYGTPDRSSWGRDIAVPERSQMIYPNGGESWCSPTSTSMVLAYWGQKLNRGDMNVAVPTAAAQTYDRIYDGNGNWPFNTAWAASFGLESYVTRFNSLVQVEPWIKVGIPVIVSVAYQPGQLPGTPIPSSPGHLLVIRGFDQSGNVITNDPAADPRLGQSTRIVYPRSSFQQVWLQSSGGAAYLIYPASANLPHDPLGGGWASNSTTSAFADSAMAAVWQANDGSVAAQQVKRTWLWGPQPDTSARLENYAQSPAGVRTVQYFDKGRMEMTNPAAGRGNQWFITSGLLTVELVSGQMQTGDSSYVKKSPAAIPVAGDPNAANTPTYATFTNIASLPATNNRAAPNRVGQSITATLDRNGNQGQNANLGHYTSSVYYDTALGHNVPSVFWKWMNDSASGFGGQWLYLLGHPISEAYWVSTTINGQSATVLVQLFERRVLTYNPANAAGWQVEMGNIGQHYYHWRYGNS